MKYTHYILFNILLLIAFNTVSAQTNDNARSLVKEGIKLNDDKKYTEAIDKYNQALKIDSTYLFADYQLAFSLFSSDKGKDALPYLDKIIKANTSLNAAASDLEGLIYFKDKQYGEAERSAIEAIKADPKHASSQRMYALVSFHQNKRAQALLGFCSFILLEPGTARSAEAYGNIQHILQGGTLKPEPGEMVSHAIEANTNALNQAITQVVSEAGKRKYATAADLLAAQLKAIFTNIGQVAEKQTGNDFFRNYMAAYFYKMAQSPNIPALAHLISASSKDDYAKWAATYGKEATDLDNWVKQTERGF